MAEARVLVMEPAPHVVHALHVSAFWTVLNEPLAQAEQVRLLIGVPSRSTRSPGAQEVCATQAVDGFASLSHVPEAQVCFAAVPPAQ